LQELRADESVSVAKSAPVDHTVSEDSASPNTPPLSASNPQSQKVGDIVATLKNVIVSNDEIRVIVDFNNQSNEKIHVEENHFGNGNFPSLTDENGHSFKYFGGMQGNRTAFVNGVNLNPQTSSSFVLTFKTSNVAFKEIGAEFAVSIPFWKPRAGSNESPEASVSFTNIRANRPK
jgi:hypothetical protein